jgi:hypothetical protein
MQEVRDVYLIECKRCGNRHWIRFEEMRVNEVRMKASLRCSRCKAREIDVGRIALPYDFPLDATLYQGYPGAGPHQVLARCSANTYAFVLFKWVSAENPHQRYVIAGDRRILKDTGDRTPT